jgi:hypothetical protein
MTLKTNRTAWSLAVTLASVACSSPPQACPGNGQGLSVAVLDAETNLYVCDATVRATTGSITVTSKPTGIDASLSDAGCFYDLYPSEAGTYRITVSASGHTMRDPPPTVVVSVGACASNINVDPSEVTVTLTP